MPTPTTETIITGAIGGAIEGFTHQPLNSLKFRKQYGGEKLFKPSILFKGATMNAASMSLCLATRMS